MLSFLAIKILSSDLNLLNIPGSLKDARNNKIIIIIYKKIIIIVIIILKNCELNKPYKNIGTDTHATVTKVGLKLHGPIKRRHPKGK